MTLKSMSYISRTIVDKIKVIRAAWRDIAPDATFAGMTLAEYEAATEPPLKLRAEMADLRTKLRGMKASQADVDQAANELADLVVNSVRGTPGFGQNSPLYSAFGYVRKSERKSGLTQKRLAASGGDATAS
jgi:type II secretory pathway component PulM